MSKQECQNVKTTKNESAGKEGEGWGTLPEEYEGCKILTLSF